MAMQKLFPPLIVDPKTIAFGVSYVEMVFYVFKVFFFKKKNRNEKSFQRMSY